jgi:putative FmdB family regulatory protein
VPTYEYACTECGERLEVVQKFSDGPLTTCEACGGKLRKVFSPVGIVFKGSGFYRTDSRNGGVPAGSKSGDSGDSSSKPDSGGSGSGDKADSTAKSDSAKPSSSSPDSGSSSSSSSSDSGSSTGKDKSSSSKSGKTSVGASSKVA